MIEKNLPVQVSLLSCSFLRGEEALGSERGKVKGRKEKKRKEQKRKEKKRKRKRKKRERNLEIPQ